MLEIAIMSYVLKNVFTIYQMLNATKCMTSLQNYIFKKG